MSVLVFGSEFDQGAWKLADELKKDFPGMEFVKTENVNDLLKVRDDVVIMDVVRNIEEPMVLGIDDLKERKISTLHDFDLGFFLQLMSRIGRISDVKIIGLPEKMDDKTIIRTGALLEKNR